MFEDVWRRVRSFKKRTGKFWRWGTALGNWRLVPQYREKPQGPEPCPHQHRSGREVF
jgi:hypothetical protein